MFKKILTLAVPLVGFAAPALAATQNLYLCSYPSGGERFYAYIDSSEQHYVETSQYPGHRSTVVQSCIREKSENPKISHPNIPGYPSYTQAQKSFYENLAAKLVLGNQSGGATEYFGSAGAPLLPGEMLVEVAAIHQENDQDCTFIVASGPQGQRLLKQTCYPTN